LIGLVLTGGKKVSDTNPYLGVDVMEISKDINKVVYTAEQVAAAIKDITDIKESLNKLSGQLTQRYYWEEKSTDSGIQLSAGPTTVKHYGIFKGACAVPTPNGLMFAFVLQRDDGKGFAIVDAAMVRPAET
jgi:hypothetical protein